MRFCFATVRLSYILNVLQPASRKTCTSLPLTLYGIVAVMGNYKCKEERHDEHPDKVSRHNADDESDERGHLPLIFFQRRVLLLNGAPDLRLLGISAVGCDHRQRHPGVVKIVDRVGSLAR